MGAGNGVEGDLVEMDADSLAVAAGQDDSRALAFDGANGAENIDRGRALVPVYALTIGLLAS